MMTPALQEKKRTEQKKLDVSAAVSTSNKRLILYLFVRMVLRLRVGKPAV